MVDCDEKPTKASALEAHMALTFEDYGSQMSIRNMMWNGLY